MTLNAPDFALLKPTTREDISTQRPVSVTSFEAEPEHKSLHFVNAQHGMDIHSPTHQTIEAAIEQFRPDLVIVEGVPTDRGVNLPGIVEYARTQVTNGAGVPEPPYAAYLANERGIDFIGGEPSREQVSQGLIARGYSSEEVMTLDVMHLVAQWRREKAPPFNDDSLDTEARETILRTEITRAIQGNHPFFSHIPQEQRTTYERAQEICQARIGKPLTAISTLDLMPLSDSQAAYFQKMNHMSGQVRDEHILGLIHDSLGRYNNVLVVYGDGHLVCQLPVLQQMFGQPGTVEQFTGRQGESVQESELMKPSPTPQPPQTTRGQRQGPDPFG